MPCCTLGLWDEVINLNTPYEATAAGLGQGGAGNGPTCTVPAQDEKAFRAALGKM